MTFRRVDYWLSEQLKRFSVLTLWEKRALIVASCTLGDEGRHWRERVRDELQEVDRLFLRWVGEKNNGRLRERLIFRLATIEGMRPGEILGLQLGDLLDQSVRVCRRVYRGDVDSTKTAGRVREVALSPVTGSLLSEWTPFLADQRPKA